jgi:DNA-binding XRE family transcriptional regulator
MAWITKKKLKKGNRNGRPMTAYLVQWRDQGRVVSSKTFHRYAEARTFKSMIEAEVESSRRIEVFETVRGDTEDSNRMMTLTARTIGEALTLLRRRSGMKRDDLAKVVGRAPGTVWRLETDQGSNVNMQYLRDLVRELCSRTGDDLTTHGSR